MAEPGELTLVCTAPLTNLALAVQRQPELASACAGGADGRRARPPGNVTPVAEFNIYADPTRRQSCLASPGRDDGRPGRHPRVMLTRADLGR